MNATIVKYKSSASLQESFISANIDDDLIFAKEKKEPIEAGVMTRTLTGYTIPPLLFGSIVFIPDIGQSADMQNDGIFYKFSGGDLINGCITKPNTLLSENVNVTILNHLGEEIEFYTRVSASQIFADFSRANIGSNIWTILIEKS